jgi:hypothetical protein
MTTALAFGLESERCPNAAPSPRTEITVGRDATASAGTVITVASAKDA